MTSEKKTEDKTPSSAKSSESVELDKDKLVLFSRFLKQQEREMSIKEKEFEAKQGEVALEQQKDNHQYEYALKSLETQERDRKDERQHNKELMTAKMKYALLAAAVFFIFLGFLVAIGKDDVALKLIGGAITVVSLVYGSYQYGKNKKSD